MQCRRMTFRTCIDSTAIFIGVVRTVTVVNTIPFVNTVGVVRPCRRCIALLFPLFAVLHASPSSDFHLMLKMKFSYVTLTNVDHIKSTISWHVDMTKLIRCFPLAVKLHLLQVDKVEITYNQLLIQSDAMFPTLLFNATIQPLHHFSASHKHHIQVFRFILNDRHL